MSKPSSIIAGATSAIEVMKSAIDAASDLSDVWRLLAKSFVKVINVHPYAQIAWLILSPPLKAIMGQKSQDDDIRDLLNTIKDVYESLQAADTLVTVKDTRKMTVLMCRQTAECAWFISDYASRGFGMPIFITDHDKKVEECRETFETLKDDFLRQSATVTEIAFGQIRANII